MTDNQMMPQLIVVGDQRLADALATCGAQWQVYPAAINVATLWDNTENGTLPSQATAIVFTDGTPDTDDNLLIQTLAEWAPFSDTFLISQQGRGEQVVAQTAAYMAQSGKGSYPIHLLPITDLNMSIMMMRQILSGKVAWQEQHAAVPVAAPPVQPQPEFVAPVVAPPVVEPAPAVQEFNIPTFEHLEPAQPPVAAPPVQPQPEFVAPVVAPPVVEPAPAVQEFVAPVMPEPAVAAPVFAAQQQHDNAQILSDTTPEALQDVATYSQPAANYEQANIYGQEVINALSQKFQKRPDALPGQMTIACMSSKGGSGKSTTAISLAGMIALSSAAAGDPKKVVIVDLDIRDGQIGSLINQYMPTAVSIRVMPKWDAATVTANLVHDKRLNIDALLAPVRPRNADDVGPDFYRQIIQVLQTTHDVVIMDCSVNYLDPLLGTAFALADEILFVTTLATTSVQGMARALTELFADPVEGGLGIPREKVGIVANQVIQNVGMGKDKLLRAALGAPLVGQIPAEYDEVLTQTNSNRMDNLLKHPRLGPAYYKLAKTCLPDWNLAPTTVQAAQVAAPAQAAAPKKRGFLGR